MLESAPNHSLFPQSMENWSSLKIVPGAKKVGTPGLAHSLWHKLLVFCSRRLKKVMVLLAILACTVTQNVKISVAKIE